MQKYQIAVQITKVDEVQRRVFGWASVSQSATGGLLIDKQGDVIDPAALEEGAYGFTKYSRPADVNHDGLAVGRLVESMVFTPDKQAALGVAPGMLPVGWWVGFEVSEEIAKRVGKDLHAFSIAGRALTEEIEVDDEDDDEEDEDEEEKD